MNATMESPTPPPLPPLPSRRHPNTAIVLNWLMMVFLLDGVISVVDDFTALITGVHALLALRALVAFPLLLASLGLYLLLGFLPRIPKWPIVMVLLFTPAAFLIALPFQIYHYDKLPWIGLGESLLQTAVALIALRVLRPGPLLKRPLFPESALLPREFSWAGLGRFVAGNILGLIPAVGIYLAGCAGLAVDHFSQGFVQLRPSGLQMHARTYRNPEGKKIQLIPMMHIGDSSFYKEIATTFPTNAIILMEGVSDSQGKLREKLSYKRVAETFGLTEQQAQFRPQNGEVRRADIDVSDFSPSTLELLNLMTKFHSGKATVETMSRFMQKSQDPRVAKQMWEDILFKRNDHLLQEIRKTLKESEVLVVPWGAAHMPGVSAGIEASGFTVSGEQAFTAVRFWKSGARPAAPRITTE